MGFPGGSLVKNPPANAGETGDVGFDPWVEKKWHVSLPEKFRSRRSLVEYSSWGCKRVGHNIVTEQQDEYKQLTCKTILQFHSM